MHRAQNFLSGSWKAYLSLIEESSRWHYVPRTN